MGCAIVSSDFKDSPEIIVAQLFFKSQWHNLSGAHLLWAWNHSGTTWGVRAWSGVTGQRWGLGPSPGLPININYKAGNKEFLTPGLIININGEQPDSKNRIFSGTT